MDNKIEIEIKKKLENEATIFFDELTRSITPLSFEEFDVVINDKKGEVYINGFYLEPNNILDQDVVLYEENRVFICEINENNFELNYLSHESNFFECFQIFNEPLPEKYKDVIHSFFADAAFDYSSDDFEEIEFNDPLTKKLFMSIFHK